MHLSNKDSRRNLSSPRKNFAFRVNSHFGPILMQALTFLLKWKATKDRGRSQENLMRKHTVEDSVIFLNILLQTLSKFTFQTQTVPSDS